MIASVTSFTETVTNTRAPGPFDTSSSRVFARKPSTSRFFCGVELYWSEPDRAVVVRRDQALGRDERGRAAAERDDRAHRLAGEVGEGRGVALEAHGRELRGEVGDLLGHPHALVGDEGRGGRERGREDGEQPEGGLQGESPGASARARRTARISDRARARRAGAEPRRTRPRWTVRRPVRGLLECRSRPRMPTNPRPSRGPGGIDMTPGAKRTLQVGRPARARARPARLEPARRHADGHAAHRRRREGRRRPSKVAHDARAELRELPRARREAAVLREPARRDRRSSSATWRRACATSTSRRGFAAGRTGPVPEPVLAMIEREVEGRRRCRRCRTWRCTGTRGSARAEKHAILDWVQDGARGAGGARRARAAARPPHPADPGEARRTTRPRRRSARSSTTTSGSRATTRSPARPATTSRRAAPTARRSRTASAAEGRHQRRRPPSTPPSTSCSSGTAAPRRSRRRPAARRSTRSRWAPTAGTQIVEKLNKDKALRKEFEAVYPEGFSEDDDHRRDRRVRAHAPHPELAVRQVPRRATRPRSPRTRSTATRSSSRRAARPATSGELLGGKSFEVMGRRADYFEARGDATDRRRQRPLQRDEGRDATGTTSRCRRCATWRGPSPYFHDGSKRTLTGAVDAMATYQLGRPLGEKDTQDLVGSSRR